MARSRYRLALIQDSLATLIFVGTVTISAIRLKFEPIEVSKETGNYRYGIKRPVGEGGVLALIRVQNGLRSHSLANAEVAVGFMGELVQ